MKQIFKSVRERVRCEKVIKKYLIDNETKKLCFILEKQNSKRDNKCRLEIYKLHIFTHFFNIYLFYFLNVRI